MKIKMIVAFDKERGIGYKNKLMWHIPEDLSFFKSMTLNSSIIMGRKTYLSLPVRPLKGRNNIVISKTINEKELNGAVRVKDIDQALSVAKSLPNENIFIIGGASIYSHFLNDADEIYATELNYTSLNIDRYFPELPSPDWERQELRKLGSEIPCTVYKYTRKEK